MDEIKVIALVGMPGAGKSYCVSHLTDKGVRVSQLFVDGRPIALHPPAAANGAGGFQGRGGGGGGATPPSSSNINRETPE